jgi:hypothetical protein
MKVYSLQIRNPVAAGLIGVGIIGAGVVLVTIGLALLAGLAVAGGVLGGGYALYRKLRGGPVAAPPPLTRTGLDPRLEVFSTDDAAGDRRSLPPEPKG